MAYITDYLYTGMTHGIEINTTIENPISVNDTIMVGEDIYFGISLALYNKLRQSMSQSSISGGTITNYSLTAFLCDSIDGNQNFVNVRKVKQYILNSLVESNYIVQSINSLLEDFSNHDALLESMSTNEIQKLKKSFKIIFRINLSSSPVLTQSIQNGDLVQTFNLMVDTMQHGPYEVNFEQIDTVHPNDFTDNERKQIYGKNLQMLLAEGLRCFYPKNINEIGPIPFLFGVRANGGKNENFDMYLSKMASYGYFCAVIPVDVTANQLLIFDKGRNNTDYVYEFTRNTSLNGDGYTSTVATGIILVGYIDHLNKNLNKISGGKFNNKIDFTKLIPFGHSRGGGCILSFYELLKNNIGNSLVSFYNTNLLSSSVKCYVALAPSINNMLLSDNSVVFSQFQDADDISSSSTHSKYQRGIQEAEIFKLDETTVNSLKLNYNIPALYVFPEYDQDTDSNTLSHYKAVNIDDNGNVINDKKILIIKKSNHYGAASNLDLNPNFTLLRSNKNLVNPTNNGFRMNNFSSRTMYASAKVLEFISNSVYSSGINIDNLNNKNDYSDYYGGIMSCFQTTEHIKSSDVKYTIDGFTSSSPLFTTNMSGYSFGNAIDSVLKTQLLNGGSGGYTGAPDLWGRGILFCLSHDRYTLGSTYPNDVFDRIITAQGNALVFDFFGNTTDSYLSYSYSPSPIDLSYASFIHVNATQIAGSTLNIFDENPCYFALELISNNGATAILGSSNYSYALPEYSSQFAASPNSTNMVTNYSQISPIKFRLQDFLNKNPNLGLTAISGIKLHFGSAWGTTQGSVLLDSILAI